MEKEIMSLSDRMKNYEEIYNQNFNGKYFIIRLDGNGFSKRIKKWKLRKPFDVDFHFAMVDACKEVISKIPTAKLIWTGSDEVSICCVNPSEKVSETWFGNRISKVLSLSSSFFTAYFNKYMKSSGFNMDEFPGFFDARVIVLPSIQEMSNNILSRYNDCKRNSISIWTENFYSSKEVLNKNSAEKIEMLKTKNIDWFDDNQVKPWTKYGTIIYKETLRFSNATKEVVTSTEELNTYVRTKVMSLDLLKDDIIFKDLDVFNNYLNIERD